MLHSILGCNVIPYDKPIICFNSNLHLTDLAKQGVTPIVWETKARMLLGCKSALDPIENAGQELLMDFIGMCFEFWDICSIYVYIPGTYCMFLNFLGGTYTYKPYIPSIYFLFLVQTCMSWYIPGTY